jgi:hypothetical protein
MIDPIYTFEYNKDGLVTKMVRYWMERVGTQQLILSGVKIVIQRQIL